MLIPDMMVLPLALSACYSWSRRQAGRRAVISALSWRRKPCLILPFQVSSSPPVGWGGGIHERLVGLRDWAPCDKAAHLIARRPRCLHLLPGLPDGPLKPSPAVARSRGSSLVWSRAAMALNWIARFDASVKILRGALSIYLFIWT